MAALVDQRLAQRTEVAHAVERQPLLEGHLQRVSISGSACEKLTLNTL
jgi:hypothetical protein